MICQVPVPLDSAGNVRNSWQRSISLTLQFRVILFFFLGKSCLKTELQFSDYYCLLAVHLLLDLWLEEGMSLYLLNTTWGGCG